MNVINVYKPRDVWPNIKYTKMITKKKISVLSGLDNQTQHWRGLGKFPGHMADSQGHML